MVGCKSQEVCGAGGGAGGGFVFWTTGGCTVCQVDEDVEEAEEAELDEELTDEAVEMKDDALSCGKLW